MKRKQRQRWIAMLMAVVMLSGTIGSAGLAQTPETERGTVQESGAVQAKERQLDTSLLPERVKAWTGEYETVTTQEDVYKRQGLWQPASIVRDLDGDRKRGICSWKKGRPCADQWCDTREDRGYGKPRQYEDVYKRKM